MCYGVIAAFGQGAARSRHSAVPFLLSTLIVASFVASDASAQYPGALISPNYTSPSAPLVIVPGADSTSAIQLQQLSTGMAVLSVDTTHGFIGVGVGAPAPLTFVDIETVLNQTAGSPVSINGPNTATTLTGWPSQLHLINGSNTTNNYAEIGFVDSSVSTPPKSALIGVQFTDRTNHYGDLVFATRGTTGGLGERMRVASSGFVGIGTSTPSTALQVIGTTTLAGGFVPNRNQQTGSYTFAASDYLIACAQPASTSVTITLPGASSVAAGQQFIIKDESGNASAAYPIVISGVIQGFTSGHFNITAGFGELRVYSNGSAWFLW